MHGLVQIRWTSAKSGLLIEIDLMSWFWSACVISKANAKHYVKSLLPRLVADCNTLLPGGFVFQQDNDPHTHHTTEAGMNCH